eukprot:6176088-Pleurochrysis_carterae.AAC.2
MSRGGRGGWDLQTENCVRGAAWHDKLSSAFRQESVEKDRAHCFAQSQAGRARESEPERAGERGKGKRESEEEGASVRADHWRWSLHSTTGVREEEGRSKGAKGGAVSEWVKQKGT